MYKFVLITLSATFAFTEGSIDHVTVDHLRHRRSPSPVLSGLPTKHQDYDHTSRSSYSVSYDEKKGGSYTERADGSLYDRNYENKNNTAEKQQFNKKFGNLKVTSPDSTSRIEHYNQEDSDNEKKKDSSSAGHEDIITAPVLVRGPDGTLVVAKTQPALHQVYDHKSGEETKDIHNKNIGKIVDTVGGHVIYDRNYDKSREDNRQKVFKENVGTKVVRDEYGNFRNMTYNRRAGNQTGTHKESSRGSQDTTDQQPNPYNSELIW